ncbi:E3 ubiquitin-protein ligase listerin [Octopus sinensis]|uniref:E3 ubiquitin-protein ligase listerin n=1 Tax=Octopus sinensis TaxID=2607531 RepID=A0A6P7TD79_9MOLL|nr:E3 ubiquitin-protein ligase listerin [Octopus sinensis]
MPGRPNKKQSQRTKGNVRPSNSSQAAQLLSESGTTTQGFIGFGSTTTDMGYVPVVDLDHSADMALDADLRLVLRKLSKKDSITKIKALQEFNALIKDKECKDAKAVLPYWPRIYSKISMDDNHRVREAAQQSMAVLAGSLHRELAPHLKKLMASWLLGMCDPYPTVATAAQQAFNIAFPAAKQAQALTFCQEAILDFTIDNLLNQKPETLGDPKVSSPDELTSKYHRVVSSSLLSICKLLKAFTDNSKNISKEKISKLLDSPKFWKLPKSPVNSIRSSSYLFLASLCLVLPDVAIDNMKKLSPCILLNLDENEVIVSGSVWEAVLSLINISSECWQFVSVPKAVWPKFRNVLTEGCHGNAAVISPSILPLLSKFPKDFNGQSLQFYEQFFSCFKTGICKDSVQWSGSECSAMVTSFMECVHYMVKMDLRDEDLNNCHHVFMDQLEPLVLESLVERRGTLSKSTLYNQLGTLLNSLTELHSSGVENTFAKDADNDISDSIAHRCWTSITEITLECIDSLTKEECSSRNYLPERLTQLAELLLYSKKSPANPSGKASSVKFSSSPTFDLSIDERSMSTSVSSTASLNRFQERYISKLIHKAFSLVNDNLEEWRLYLFVKYLRLYPSESIIEQLVPVKDKRQDGNIFRSFATDMLLNWLHKMHHSEKQQQQQRQSDVYVFNAIFMMLPLFNDTGHIVTFLDHLCHNLDGDRHLLKVFLLELLSSRWKVTAISKWLETSTLGELLVSITEDVCAQALVPPTAGVELSVVEDNWSVLTVALSSNSQSEPLLQMKYIEKIFFVIHSTLKKLKLCKDNHKTDLSMQFVAKVLASFFQGLEDCSLSNSAEDLILILYKFVLETDLTVSEHTRKEVRQVCINGMQTLYRRQPATSKGTSRFFLNVFQAVRDTVMYKVATTEQLQTVFGEVKTLLHTVFAEVDNGLTSPFLVEHFSHLFSVTEHVLPPKQFEEYLMITGQLSATYWDCQRHNKLNPEVPPGDFPTSTVFTSLFHTSLLDFLQDDLSEDSSDPLTSLLNPPQLLDVLYNLLCSVAVSECWVDTYNTNSELKKSVMTLHKQVTKHLDNLDDKQTDTLLDLFTQRVLSDGHWQAMGLQFLLEQKFHEKLSENRIGSYFEEEFTEKHLQMLRMLIQHCTSSASWNITQVLVTKLLSLPSDNLFSLSCAVGLLPLITMATGKWKFHEDPDKQSIFIDLLNTLSEWRNSGDHFLFHINITSASPHAVHFNVEVMNFLKLMWSQLSALDNDQCDFILCSAVSWLQSASETKCPSGSPVQVQLFMVGICKLLYEMAASLQDSQTNIPDNVISEWNEFFSETVYALVIPLYIQTAESVLSSEKDSDKQHPVVAWLGQVLTHCPQDRLLNTPLKETSSTSLSSSEKLEAILDQFCPMLLSKLYAVQITAYHVLDKIVGELHSLETQESTEMDCVKKFKKLSTRVEETSKATVHQQQAMKQYCSQFDGDEDDNSGRQPNEALMQALLESWQALEYHMDASNSSSGSSTSIEKPPVPPYCTLGYLLTWKLQLHFIKTATSELRAEYLRYLDNLSLIDVFLSDIFSLIPESLVSTHQPRKDEVTNAASAFKRDLLCTSAPPSGKLLQDMACMLYEEALETIPAVIRTWWLKQNRSFASFIDNFTKLFISPVLCKKEILNLLSMEMNLANITVRARPMSREIVAVYTLDDVSIEMVISLPENYPLGTISVHSDQRKGISCNISKKWLLQLNIFLQHQNGNIMDGLCLWKRYIDKKFEGVEECTICYCVVHGTDYHLPQKQCKTCHKKFHSICLYKWFTESQNSSCPLCRTAFVLQRH